MNKCPDCKAFLPAGEQKCDACGLSVSQEFAPTMQKPQMGDDDHTPTQVKAKIRLRYSLI